MLAMITLPLDVGGEMPQFHPAEAATWRERVVRLLRRLLRRNRRRVRRTTYLLW